MKELKITAIGEILWDIYPDQKCLGGAPFNFIYHVWKILGKANFISSVGNDTYGIQMLEKLNGIEFPTEHISVDNKYPTGTVKVTLDQNKTPHFTMSGESCFDFFVLNKKGKKLIEEKTDILYFGTFAQRNETARKTIQSTFGKKIKYFCDLNLRHDFFTKEMVTESLITSNVVKLNDSELETLKSYFNLSSDDSTAIKQLINQFNIDLLSVTLGGEGAILSDGVGIDYYKTTQINVVDTLGAGDAFAAILCLGYMNDWDLQKTNRRANDFASEICKIVGAIPEDDFIYSRFINELGNLKEWI